MASQVGDSTVMLQLLLRSRCPGFLDHLRDAVLPGFGCAPQLAVPYVQHMAAAETARSFKPAWVHLVRSVRSMRGLPFGLS
jgi:hypothetical protein